MKKLLQINTVCNSGSTGRIAEEIGLLAIKNGWQSYIAYGRGNRPSASNKYRIGSNFDMYLNALKTRLFDIEGFTAKQATLKLIQYIQQIKPDLIQLHNLHGYYLNINILFRYLSSVNIPIVWTLHDCWAFTGHCVHFEYVNCNKWKTACYRCPQKTEYPSSFFLDNSKRNFQIKKRLFTSTKNLHIITPSEWLSDLVKQSFLSKYPISIINNGVDLKVFHYTQLSEIRQKYHLGLNKIILGVAGIWSERKGLKYFDELNSLIAKNTQIVLVGLSKKQINQLPKGILGIERTENVNELAALYSLADVFVNPTLEDNFPTTNIEAMACGTPIITFKTGGSIESVSPSTGLIVPQGDIVKLKEAIDIILAKNKETYKIMCIERVNKLYNSSERYNEYLSLYNQLI